VEQTTIVARGSKWKWRAVSFALGVVILGIVVGLSVFISDDLRLLYAVGCILLFSSALWIGPRTRGDWPSPLLLCAPLVCTFGFYLVRGLPFLWPNILLWAVAAALGLPLLKAARHLRIQAICGVVVLIVVSAWYCSRYIPDQLQRSFHHFGDDPASAFTLQPVSDGTVPTAATPGKILVIDFFATWCPPCLAELPEIVAVRADLKDRDDIEIVVAGTNAGGDTPERLRSFAQRRHLTLPLAFDAEKKARSALGMTGFPALVVIDRKGRARLRIEGYNRSEVNFRRDLVQLLRGL
jgi:peroxiredoxin